MDDERSARFERLVLPVLRCVRCGGEALEPKGALNEPGSGLLCRLCSQVYPLHRGIPIMTLSPDDALGFSSAVVVENAYSEQWLSLIQKAGSERVLDLGSGNNPARHENVLKMDVFALPNVDVVGRAERLPFRDGAFRTVFSGAVFEHLREPFAAIEDVRRVLRPGGDVYVETAFLQPVHAFPDHYFNMTLRGLERLCQSFERLDSGVRAHQAPSFMLAWVLRVWAMKLGEVERADFLNTKIGDILAEYDGNVFSQRWMTGFTRKDHEELAAGVYFHGYKPET